MLMTFARGMTSQTALSLLILVLPGLVALPEMESRFARTLAIFRVLTGDFVAGYSQAKARRHFHVHF